MRTDNDTYRSLNESINGVQNPQVALHEAQEYASVLEAALDFVCEELEITPDELFEMAMTAGRVRQLGGKVNKQAIKTAQAWRADEKAGRGNPNYTHPGDRKSRRPTAIEFSKQHKKSEKVNARFRDEHESPKVYGMGGKVVANTKYAAKKKGIRVKTNIDPGHWGGNQRKRGGGFQDA
jgi:hypothetical protein